MPWTGTCDLDDIATSCECLSPTSAIVPCTGLMSPTIVRSIQSECRFCIRSVQPSRRAIDFSTIPRTPGPEALETAQAKNGDL